MGKISCKCSRKNQSIEKNILLNHGLWMFMADVCGCLIHEVHEVLHCPWRPAFGLPGALLGDSAQDLFASGSMGMVANNIFSD